ncbi:hypothetical protein AB205_0002480, partial [Aquarana catesbeiana]
AIDYYHKALKSLDKRDTHQAVWDSVYWELSTTYFTMATLLQDYAPISRKAQEQVGDEHTRKQHRVLADLQYSKAVKLFQVLKDAPCELLRVQLERVAFAEFQMSSK